MPDLNQPLNCVIGEADPFLASLVRRMVEKSGFTVLSAQTGEGVLDLVRSSTPAFVVIEPELPGKLRGWEVVQALALSSETSRLAVILFSWLNRDEALALVGCERVHLAKPDLHPEDLIAALNQAGCLSLPFDSKNTESRESN